MLLYENEKSPFEAVNACSRAPFIITAEHAGNRVPAALNGLGLAPDVLEKHYAYDLGAARIARELSKRLDCFAIVGNYSRLVVDLNREISSSELFARKRFVEVPGNAEIPPASRAQRINELWRPYHDRIAGKIFDALAAGIVPLFISIHTMSPDLPYDLAILYDKDVRFQNFLRDRFSYIMPGLRLGMNEPYDANAVKGTLSIHAEPYGLPCAEIEFNQALLGNTEMLEKCIEIISVAAIDFMSVGGV